MPTSSIAGWRPVKLRCSAICCLVALATAPSPALAASPEELEQLEPGKGEFQLEYSNLLGVRSKHEHSLQALVGISDRLAIGLEVETEWSAGSLTFEGVAPTILYRFTDPSHAIGVGVGVGAQVELDADLRIASAESRLILEKKTRLWWAQGNLIARHVREDKESWSALGYSWGLSRSIGKDAWLGAEGSGSGVRVAGSTSAIPDDGHFVGPSLTIDHELAGSEVEVGVASLHRIAGEGPSVAARFFVQFGL